MSKLDTFFEALSLMTVGRHQQLLSTTKQQLNSAWKRQQDIEKKSRDDSDLERTKLHEETLTEKVSASYELGFSKGREHERVEAARRIREAAEEAARKEREAAEARARWLVSPDPVGFTMRNISDLRTDVAAKLKNQPEPDQWKMILANSPATYVIAGAGSGKSTSLVLRVIGLNLYVGIDRSRISVFTFTKDSRQDFIKKLIDRMELWGVELTEADAKGIVRTFHSMVLKMGRTTINKNLKVLELIDRERKGPVKDIDVENLLEVKEEESDDDESDEPEHLADPVDVVEGDDDSHAVDDYLRLAYERAIKGSAEFRELMLKLLKLSFTQVRRAPDDKTEGHKRWIASIDEEMTRAVDRKWRNEIAPDHWPLEGIDDTLVSISVSSQVAEKYWVNGYIPQMDAYVVLGGATNFEHIQYPELPNPPAINSKRKLLAAISEKPVIWIDNIGQLIRLQTKLKWLTDQGDKRIEVPMFNLVAPGDFKSRPILKGFYGLAQFVENLGLSVEEALKNAQSNEQNKLWSDVIFMRATAIFWEYFEQALKEDNVWTFNQLFAYFSEDHPDHFAKVPPYVLRAMQHLLIDEFQDVSPQIVKWIRGCQRELVRRGDAGSLTCIGDDYQSIYGWRGSSPEFFVKFKHWFPAVSHDKLLLEDNFRSSDNILRCAESVLVGVDGMEPKTSRAKGSWASSPAPVAINLYKEKLPYDEIRRHISAEITRTAAIKDHPMLVLSRSRAAHEPLSKSPSKDWGKSVQFMTFHGAKGLEGRSVILLGDCFYSGTNPVKNYLYKAAGLGSYDDSQQAESRRVAYVGITRAMERCTWYAVKNENGAIGSIPTGRHFVTINLEK
ncbi:UvrD-helicase domain-containing protein [Duganella sp. FT135W]|uniref:DNA 3'-5' helicase n=1 Tax=Duganella flavida TaxID=2692175 RepID=A0A6L8KFT0_9BURK|nr:UvrD-helicase domain-containing protein [Duganella flavida]MYM26303.1 UvrD-helicase domain-containing protein [Duganella flavida]